ncbi:7-cyano-7-deazaguanine synthase QueC [Candidatus Poribacteria bacterium]|nr:7-cyano-7-deazaguanine synthase QueC [Candidatus Poribacteria bacterium]
MREQTVAAIARADGHSVYALSFDYGQRHRHELHAASQIADALDVAEHRTVVVDLRVFGASALTADIDVPKHRSADHIGDGIPITYVPARNTIFLSFALGYAEVVDAADIYIGVNALDYSGYPDCRPEYIAAYEQMANLATKAAVEGVARVSIRAPLIDMTKARIIQRGRELGVDFSMTRSCYDPSRDGAACGGCDSCLLRAKGFADAGVPDPTIYAQPTSPVETPS